MTKRKSHIRAKLTVLIGILSSSAAQAEPQFLLPRTGIDNTEIAILVNDNDPLSRDVAAYYQAARAIPASNVLHVQIPVDQPRLTRQQTQTLVADIQARTPSSIQAYALAWTRPYQADCMSMTSAVALGFDEKYCSSRCGATASSAYFDADTTSPYSSTQKLRPAMMLAGQTLEQIKALIDRGVRADFSYPDGTAYLLSTSDRARNVRAVQFEALHRKLVGVYPLAIMKADSIKAQNDVLFYFTGLSQVPQLDSLGFVPGALADHLTSSGGDLLGTKQMSSLRWLEAGATASYGTVVEPCNHPQKFPAPEMVMSHYAAGATAIEAYWKSVAWPGEGLFIGEPLARPFAPSVKPLGNKPLGNRDYELTVFALREGAWQIDIAAAPSAAFQSLTTLSVHRGKNILRFTLPVEGAALVRLQPR